HAAKSDCRRFQSAFSKLALLHVFSSRASEFHSPHSNDKARHWAGPVGCAGTLSLVPVGILHAGLDLAHCLVYELQGSFPMTAFVRVRILQALLGLLQVLHGRLHIGLVLLSASLRVPTATPSTPSPIASSPAAE